MNKVLVVADVNWWAFERIVQGLKKYCTQWKVDAHYLRADTNIPHNNYDVIFYLCDWITEPIFENRIPRDKLVLAIRQAEDLPYSLYTEPGKLQKTVKMVAVSNKDLVNKYISKHDTVRIASGGVDTDFFSFKEKFFEEPVRVGWAGSSGNFGREFRGLDLIQEACDKIGFIFNPAIREKRLRTIEEMREYYHNQIDIYVDMSFSAGRQNGLIEAGSCGLTIISCRSGVAEDLIIHGYNGFLIQRNVESLSLNLAAVNNNSFVYGKRIRSDIEGKWSWKVQAPIFERIFEECVNEVP